jgi:hypothetical protein
MHLPPIVALWLTFGFVSFLFRREFREKTNVMRAIWIPLVWLLITGSKPASQWLTLRSGVIGSPGEGSPVAAAVYFALTVAAYNIRGVKPVDAFLFIQVLT